MNNEKKSFYMIVGESIEKERKRQKLSAEELGDRIGVKKKTIRRYETGEIRINMERLESIALALGISISSLVCNHDKDELNNDDLSIQKELQRMIDGLKSGKYASFDGQSIAELVEGDKELLTASLENSLLLAKRIAKKN